MKSTMKQAPQHKLFAAIAVLIAFVALYSPMRAYASFSDLYDFGGLPDGNNPTGNLVSDPTNPDTLYGITTNGGNTGGAYGLGTVYTINLSTGAESVIHAFGSDEAHNPVGGLLLVTPTGGTEVLFGCTSGGPSPGDAPQIFRIKLTGSAPYADTISTLPGIAGNLYGTTIGNGVYEQGTLFEFEPGMSPTMVTLNNFESPGTTDGLVPDGAPLEVTDDSGTWLVGVTEIGGTDHNGTVYVGAFP
jgi:hypothetical protein